MRKILVLLTTLFVVVSSVSWAQMNGSYTIGTGGDYTTISEAIDSINSRGLSGDIILNIDSGTYTEQINLTDLNNGAHHVTITGKGAESTRIEPVNLDATAWRAAVLVLRTDNITIKNMTIDISDTSFASSLRTAAIWMTDADNISVANNIVHSYQRGIFVQLSNDIQAFNNIVASKGVTLQVQSCSRIDLIHNTFHSDQVGGRNYKSDSSYSVGTQPVTHFEGALQDIVLQNNIFSGVEPQDPDGNAAIFVNSFSGKTIELTSDFNLFDADLGMAVDGETSETIVNGDTVFGQFSLSQWKDTVGLDLNSASISPVFLDTTNFRIGNTDFRFGTYLADFVEDIDGELRLEGAVDVGADQYCETIEVTDSIGACESYVFAGDTLTVSGEYFGEFIATNKCDSLVTLHLTILEPTAGSDDITAEGSYDWNGTLYTESGSYEQTLTNQAGCDSTATLNLTIEPYFLEGNFIIGSSVAADFSNFEEAIADLQYATLSGDVEYTVEAGTYNETLEINSINSGDHSISFIGEDRTTTILHPMGSIDESKAGVLISGTNNVILQNLTLEMDDISAEPVISSEATTGVSVVDADNTFLDNLELKNESETNPYNAGRLFITHALSIENVNTLVVSNSTFSDARFHITIGNHSNVRIEENMFETARELIRNTVTGSNLSIKSNNLEGPFQRGINLRGLEAVSILSNEIDGVIKESSFSGIELQETSGSIIEGNRIENVRTGIDLIIDTLSLVNRNIILSIDRDAIYAGASESPIISNNFLEGYLDLEYFTNMNLVHNTIICKTDQDQVILVADPLSSQGISDSILNNIIVGGDSVINLLEITGIADSSTLTLDHNLYFLEPHYDTSQVTALVHYNDTGYSTLADWQNGQTAIRFDENSQSFEPTFLADDDFHITSTSDYRFGTFLSDFDADIDGHQRDATTGVDVGADQNCDPCTIIWDGQWSNTSGPTASDHAIIMEEYVVRNGETLKVNELNLLSDHLLEVQTGGNLVVNGDFSASGNVLVRSGGSLLTYGTIEGDSFQIERNTTFDEHTGRYSILGSPVESATIGDFGSLVYSYNVDGDVADNFIARFERQSNPSDLVNVGKGYFSAFTGTVTFTGTPNTGDLMVQLDTGQDAALAYNLVANPYPSAISYERFMNGNLGVINGAAWFWADQGSDNGRGSSADYLVVSMLAPNMAVGPRSEDWNGTIGTAQGFFVLPVDAQLSDNGRILGFADSMKVMDNMDGSFFRTRTATTELLLLSVAGEAGQATTLIGFKEDASTGFDTRYDAPRLKRGDLALYTLDANNKPMVIQALPFASLPTGETHQASTMIPLGMEIPKSGSYSINLEQQNEIDSYIYLVDHLTNERFDIRSGSYSFDAIAGMDNHRLSLELMSRESTVAEPTTSIRVYAYQGYLNIVAPTDGYMKVIDLGGKTITKHAFSEGHHRVPMLRDGIFIVTIEAQGLMLRTKVHIQN